MSKRRRHTPNQIIRKLAEGNSSWPAAPSSTRCAGTLQIAESTWHRWLSQYGGMKANDAKRLKELEAENARLKKLVAGAELRVSRVSCEVVSAGCRGCGRGRRGERVEYLFPALGVAAELAASVVADVVDGKVEDLEHGVVGGNEPPDSGRSRGAG